VQAETTGMPWKPATQIADAQGMNLAVFGYPGAGKTRFAASGPKPIIIDADGTAARTLRNRADVMLFQPKDWLDCEKISRTLLHKKHDFETVCWDTLTSLQRFALKNVMSASATPQMPNMGEYGKANEMVVALVDDWCSAARERGINVVFNVHAEEVKDESTGVVLIRMSLTPGAMKGVYRAVDTIGYIAEQNTKDGRAFRLLLHSNNRIVAKHHQPEEGDGIIPLEIDAPDLGKIIAKSKHRSTEMEQA
jgi:hypothetical protein